MEGETRYSVKDFAKNARKVFGVPPEAVTVALRSAGKEQATIPEAYDIVKAFLEKEVK